MSWGKESFTKRRFFDWLTSIFPNKKKPEKARALDWVKKNNTFYYQIIKQTQDGFIIKGAFDDNFVFAKQSSRVDGFTIMFTDLKEYQFLEKEELLKVKSFFADNPEAEADFLRYTDLMLSLREKLLRANFQAATLDFRHFSFYRYTLEKVAFIVNLVDRGDRIDVTYGFTTVTDRNFLIQYCESNSNIKLRFRSVIKTEQDIVTVAKEVQSVYDTYSGKTKDEILSLKRDRQRQFLQKISDQLKPLGFKKKGARWIKSSDGDFCFEFYAQKSRFSDEYYFNVNVYHRDIEFPRCYSTRIVTNREDLYDWQLMTDEELYCLLNGAIQNILTPIISTPLAELGKQKYIWRGCTCPRTKCDTCWVQKNLWEAKETKWGRIYKE